MTSNYGASHEIDAYRAQFAANGFLEYPVIQTYELLNYVEPKTISRYLYDINKIKLGFVRTLLEIDKNGNIRPIYNF